MDIRGVLGLAKGALERPDIAGRSRSWRQSTWPLIENIDAIEEDNAKTLLERADALLKAQDDGLKAMEARMSSLFGQSVTLASAAVGATVTAFAANAQTGGSSPPWALPWVGQSLALLSIVWLVAVGVAASSMLSQNWSVSGMQPRDLYTEALLTAPPNSLRLAIARMLQHAIDDNTIRTVRYGRRLSWVIGLLAAGPVVTVAGALAFARPYWRPLLGAAVFLAAYVFMVWCLYRKARVPASPP